MPRLRPTTVAMAVVLARLPRGPRGRPPPASGESPEGAPVISGVVPARDEEHRLPACLAALAGDAAISEVVVVDDRSSDDTAGVATRAGARVVRGAPLPDGWGGKAWALEQGLAAARGEIVVFLDADARPRPGLLAALARELDHVDVVSAGPRFACDGAAAQALHASMLATLVYRFGPTDVDGWQPRPGRAVLNG